MRAFLIFLPLLLLVGGLYFWVSRQTPSQGPETALQTGIELEGEPVAPVASEPTPVAPLRELASEPRAEAPAPDNIDLRYPLELDLVLVQPGPKAESAGGEFGAGAKAILRGSVHTDDGTPLPGSVVFIAGANKNRELPCASDGTFLANDLYPGLAIVRIESGRGQISEREVTLGNFGNTELNISFGSRSGARVTGRVQDEFGQPITGARLRVDGQAAISNEEGRFEVYQTTAGKILIVIEADGYARYREELSISRGTVVEPDRLVFQLEREATLDLEVTGISSQSDPVQIYLFPAGGQRVNTQRGQRTFPWYTVNPIEVRPGVTTTVRNLPPGAVTVMGFQSGAIATPLRRNVKLIGGQRTSTKVAFEPGPALLGQATWQGKPAAGARVRLEALDASQASMLALGRRPSFLMEMVVDILPPANQSVVADGAGRFQLTTQPDLQAEYLLFVTSADGKGRAIQRVGGAQLNGELAIELLPVVDGSGSLAIDFPGVGVSFPYRVRVQGKVGEIQTLPLGDTLLVPDLPCGLWRLDASRFQRYATRGQRFWIEDGVQTQQTLRLDEELWKIVR
ncbi:MAG: carboxypeptidase regulatory-like domain-containing protein [Planctomycetes bacterium]|nr:carboxypeptidase regulatory-like domain-containing protein [Planctomycetota bacterium]MCB9908863.1 carboxypeptidase regulatory-like domain-containing protein [Planctomycetota bacterium]HPF14070.1 carboxypeptidase-like regulatory domain-containing protein [Planctomycetota bacterium]